VQYFINTSIASTVKGNDNDMQVTFNMCDCASLKFACVIMFVKEGKNIYKTTSHVESVHLRTAL
jgi:hypothetical protein